MLIDSMAAVNPILLMGWVLMVFLFAFSFPLLAGLLYDMKRGRDKKAAVVAYLAGIALYVCANIEMMAAPYRWRDATFATTAHIVVALTAGGALAAIAILLRHARKANRLS